jgi:hypothetical protein
MVMAESTVHLLFTHLVDHALTSPRQRVRPADDAEVGLRLGLWMTIHPGTLKRLQFG